MSLDKISDASGGIGGAVNTSSSTDDEKLALELKRKDYAFDDSATFTSTSYVSSKPEAQGFKNILEIADKAVTEVGRLRKMQLELATRAKDSIDSTESTQLQDEYNSIQTELSRINTSATYNGTRIFDGLKLDTIDSQKNIAEINGLANLTPIVSNLSLSLGNNAASASSDNSFYAPNRANATAAETALKAFNLGVYSSQGDTISKYDQSKDIIEATPAKAPDKLPHDTEPLRLPEQAQQLAIGVAKAILKTKPLVDPESKDKTISETLGGENSIFPIHQLDPDKVRKLLE